MILRFLKRVTEYGENYILNEVVDAKKETLDLIKEGVLQIIDTNEAEYLEDFPLGIDDLVGLFVVRTTTYDDGDYDIEDNYEPYITEAYSYYPCHYCPITGDEIKVEIVGEVDSKDESKALQEKLVKLSKCVQKSKVEERHETSRNLNALLHSDFSKIDEYLS